MPSTLFTSPRSRQLTSSGAVLPGCKLYFYVSGTLTPATTYQNAGLTVAHANPVLADTGGLFPAIWLDNSVSYDVTLKTSTGATVWSVSAISGAVTDILILTSQATAEPYSSTYVEFQEPDESRKGVVGFLSSATNVFYQYSYRAAKMIFGTGNVAEDNAVARASLGGTDTSTAWELFCHGASNLGGGVLKFMLGATSTIKAVIGFASEADNHFDIDNQVAGGNVELKATATGKIIACAGGTNTVEVSSTDMTLTGVGLVLSVGTESAPSLSFLADTDTGVFRASNNRLGFAANGTNAVSVSSTGLMLLDGVTAPSTVSGWAQLYVDTADGDLKVKFGDGTIKTIVIDT